VATYEAQARVGTQLAASVLSLTLTLTLTLTLALALTLTLSNPNPNPNPTPNPSPSPGASGHADSRLRAECTRGHRPRRWCHRLSSVTEG